MFLWRGTRIAELFYQLFGVLVQTRMIYHQWKLVMIFKACNFLFLCWVCVLVITNLMHLLLELKSQPSLILKSFVRVINCKVNLFLHRKNHYWHESEKWTILRYMLQDCLQSKLLKRSGFKWIDFLTTRILSGILTHPNFSHLRLIYLTLINAVCNFSYR